MIRINLLPVKAARQRETQKQRLVAVGAGAVFLVGVMGYLYLSTQAEVSAVQAQIVRSDAELKRLQALVAQVNQFKADRKVLEDKLKVIEVLEKGKAGPLRVLDNLSTSVTPRLWLTAFQEKDLRLVLEGVALDNDQVATFMNNLARSPSFKNVELLISQQVEERGLKLKRFTINGTVDLGTPPPPPPPAPPARKR